MTERKSHLDTLAVSSLLLCCVLWGLNQVAAKTTLAEIPPLMQASARSLGATLLVALWAGARGIPLFERDGTLAGGLLAGALFGAEFACIFTGLQFTAASRMVVFIYLSPFIVVLGMPFIARAERLSALQLGGLVAAFGGVAWAFAEGFNAPAAGERQWIGDALGVCAAALWGATTLVIRATPLAAVNGREDAALPAGRLRGAARTRFGARRRALAREIDLGVAGPTRVPDRDRELCQLLAVVLADSPLSCHAVGLVHATDADFRPARRRGAVERADHAAPRHRAGCRGRGHRDRHPS